VARASHKVPENAPGDLFVDDACISCDACRRIAPRTFGGGEDERSFVARQPATPDERRDALQALVACPVSAIGSVVHDRVEVKRAARSFPSPVEGAPGVFDCGYASPRSFGASSWLVRREGGNVLVDSPRFAAVLALSIEELGGAALMFLTHRDDVADHASWVRRLRCARVMHVRDDVGVHAERRVEGDEPVALAPDLLAVPVPGHTPGSCALLWDEACLFTGDHVWGDAHGELHASRAVCWWRWDAQIRSMERLLEHRFEWIFPGHGRPWRARSPAHARDALARLVREMRAEPI
jgi:glyoxylase-like metal-dependent hydrolase (beta-lactamase superfamily II)/ferredoxin